MRSDFWNILHALNRRAELLRLIQWAEHKRLPGPLRCYQARLIEVETRLTRYAVHSPRLTRRVRWLHRISRVLLPNPRSYRRGTAAGYRRSRLTSISKKAYSKVT